ncbi:glycosyltransferase [Herbiconiux sp. SYSU D00978]|uniref:glycosyltransferase n=1 Tax=Herbiconiux sp. SYSU D00978 TaxID=2812562 RepID=UPI001A974060|nr:glycosyltransferase [Herbiconiux sp. SYSU D00978]
MLHTVPPRPPGLSQGRVEELSAESASYAELLLASNLISIEQLALARAAKERTGSHIDEILVGLGIVEPSALLRVMGLAWDLQRIDLHEASVDPELVRLFGARRYLEENWMPVSYTPSGAVLVATAREPLPEREAMISGALKAPVEFAVATSWEIKAAVLAALGHEIAETAAHELYRQNPVVSARTLLGRPQKIAAALGLFLLATLVALWSATVVGALLSVAAAVFAVATLTRLAPLVIRRDVVERIDAEELPALDDRDLPVYTVLVPSVGGTGLTPRFIRSLRRLDWPVEKLEVLVLADGADAARAASALDLPPNVHVVTLPAGGPRTRARACNIGLFLAAGEFVAVFDSRDDPDPDQLKKVFLAFARLGDSAAAVQTRRSIGNPATNLLTRLAELECRHWYRQVVAAFGAFGLAVPVGGGTAHFRTRALADLGGWDAYNATAEADLRVRASAFGYRVGFVDSTSSVTAPTTLRPLLAEAARWARGYLQTTLVHSRRAAHLVRAVGRRRALGFGMFIAATPALQLGVLPAGLLALVSAAVLTGTLHPVLPVPLLAGGLALYLAGMGTLVLVAVLDEPSRRPVALARAALLAPVYWTLVSLAAHAGVWQLVLTRRPR